MKLPTLKKVTQHISIIIIAITVLANLIGKWDYDKATYYLLFGIVVYIITFSN